MRILEIREIMLVLAVLFAFGSSTTAAPNLAVKEPIKCQSKCKVCKRVGNQAVRKNENPQPKKITHRVTNLQVMRHQQNKMRTNNATLAVMTQSMVIC
jgi:hypothetical protein